MVDLWFRQANRYVVPLPRYEVTGKMAGLQQDDSWRGKVRRAVVSLAETSEDGTFSRADIRKAVGIEERPYGLQPAVEQAINVLTEASARTHRPMLVRVGNGRYRLADES